MRVNFNKLKLKILILVGLLLFAILSFLTYAIAVGTYSEGYRVNTGVGPQNITIDASGTCKKITNTSGKDLFIPTKGVAEWNAFVANKPAGVTIEDCLNKITNCTELQNMKNNLSASYELANNIDCSATSGWNGGLGFEPIGPMLSYFTGKFDGKGYTISNLYVNRPTANLVGLFAYLVTPAEVKNVGLISAQITGWQNVGCVAGYEFNSYGISNSYCAGNISGASGSVTVGGLVGYQGAPIANSYFVGNVIGDTEVGGLAGRMQGNIANSYSSGTVRARGTYAGGLVGIMITGVYEIKNSYSSSDVSVIAKVPAVQNPGMTGGLVGYAQYGLTINNGYATGNVTGGNYLSENYVGGLIGYDSATVSGSIINSYSIGLVSAGTSISGTNYLGGFAGRPPNAGLISNSYWNTETSSRANGCGTGTCTGVTGKTTALMTLPSTYSGWDFTNTWKVVSPSFPCLKWQSDETCK